MNGPPSAKHPALLRIVTAVVVIAGLASAIVVVLALTPTCPRSAWWLRLNVFVATGALPFLLVEGVAQLATALSPDLGDAHVVGFRNPGAFLGVTERLLLLGALVAGAPGFFVVWYGFKGIVGWRDAGLRERRYFQLELLNNAVSLSGVALGWLAWHVLGLNR